MRRHTESVVCRTRGSEPVNNGCRHESPTLNKSKLRKYLNQHYLMTYPISTIVLSTLQEYQKIEIKLKSKLNGQSRSKLEIVRLLNNPQLHENILYQIDQHLNSVGNIGDSLLAEADPVRLSQRLVEFVQLVNLQVLPRYLWVQV